MSFASWDVTTPTKQDSVNKKEGKAIGQATGSVCQIVSIDPYPPWLNPHVC